MNRMIETLIFGRGSGKIALRSIAAGLVALSLAHPAMATNYARQFDIANCGAYEFSMFRIERRGEGTNGNWDTVDIIYKGVTSDRAICMDISDIKDKHGELVFGDGDEARVTVSIALGETVNCDSTNFPLADTDEPSSTENEKHRRRLIMRGDTFSNNGCRTIEYREVLPHSQCRNNGSTRVIKCKG